MLRTKDGTSLLRKQLPRHAGNNPAGVSYAAGCGVPKWVTAQHHRDATGFPPDCSPTKTCPASCTSGACPSARYLNECQARWAPS